MESSYLSKQNNKQQSDESQYQIYQIVWAKVAGYPWWPGKIISFHSSQNNNEELKLGRKPSIKGPSQKMYTVLFIKQGSIATLGSSKIKPYFLGKKSPNNAKYLKMDTQTEKQLQQAKNLFDSELKTAMKYYGTDVELSELSLKSRKSQQNLQNSDEEQQSMKSIISIKSSDIKSFELKRSSSGKKIKNQKRERKTSLTQKYKEISEPKEDNELEKIQMIYRSAQKQNKLISHQGISGQKVDEQEPIEGKQRNLKKIYLEILTRKGFDRRRSLGMAKKILNRSKDQFNLLDKLGEQEIIKLLKEKTMQELLEIL